LKKKLKKKKVSFKKRVAVQAIASCNKLQKSIGQQASPCREGEVVNKAEAACMQSKRRLREERDFAQSFAVKGTDSTASHPGLQRCAKTMPKEKIAFFTRKLLSWYL